MVANPSLGSRSATLVAVVDDVVTTGTSVGEAVRALAEVGVDVNAVFALAETLRKTQQKV
jgi:orotate phosphoribosyltransferase